MPAIYALISSTRTPYQRHLNHPEEPETSASIVQCNSHPGRGLRFSSLFQYAQTPSKKSKVTPWKRPKPPETLSSTLKLLQAARGSDVLETLERSKTIVPQSFFLASDNQTGNRAGPRFDLTLFEVIQGIEILLQKKGQVSIVSQISCWVATVGHVPSRALPGPHESCAWRSTQPLHRSARASSC